MPSTWPSAITSSWIIPPLGLKYLKRNNPIRLTPTFDQFKAIVADIRAQPFNREAEHSGDFAEFFGLAGLGQAEAASIKRTCRLDAGRSIIYRHKAGERFTIPIYPQLRPLLEKLCKGKKHNERLFSINQARKAITNACGRFGTPDLHAPITSRRMFITRAIEKGVDVKVIAEWQGHRDGGKLILQTYSHVNRIILIAWRNS